MMMNIFVNHHQRHLLYLLVASVIIIILSALSATHQEVHVHAAATTRDCSSPAQRTVTGGNHPDGIEFSADTCAGSITVQDLTMGQELWFDVNDFDGDITIKNVIMEGLDTAWAILFLRGDRDQLVSGNILIENVTLKHGAVTRRLLYFGEPISFDTNDRQIIIRDSDIFLGGSSTLVSSVVHITDPANFPKLLIENNNISCTSCGQASVVFNNKGLTSMPPGFNEFVNGVHILNNNVTFERTGSSMTARIISNAVDSYWNVTNLLIENNNIYFSSKLDESSSKVQDLAYFSEFGPAASTASILRSYHLMIRNNKFEAHTEDEMAILYFAKQPNFDKVELNISVHQNDFTVETATGFVMVDFEAQTQATNVSVEDNIINVSFTAQKFITSSPYNFPLYFAEKFVGTPHSTINFNNNTITSSHYHNSRFYLRLDDVEEAQEFNVENNTIKINVKDSQLIEASLVSSKSTIRTPVVIKNNSFLVEYSSTNESEMPPDNSIPKFRLFVGTVERGTGDFAGDERDDLEIRNNSLTVRRSSASGVVAAKDFIFNASITAVYVLENSSDMRLTFEDNGIDLSLKGNSSLVLFEDVKSCNKTVVANNTAICGFSGPTSLAKNSVYCTSHSAITIYRGSKSITNFPSSTLPTFNDTVISENTFTSRCAVPDFSSKTNPDFGTFPSHSLLVVHNASHHKLKIEDNAFAHTYCSGVQIARFLIGPDESEISSSSSQQQALEVPSLFESGKFTNNNITSLRCDPSCEFIGIQPFYDVENLNNPNNNKYISIAASPRPDAAIRSFTIENNMLAIPKNSQSTNELISFMNFCRHPETTGNGERVPRCDASFSANNNNFNRSLPVYFGTSSYKIELNRNRLACTDLAGVVSAVGSDCVFDFNVANFSTILFRSSSPNVFGSNANLRLEGNNLLSRFISPAAPNDALPLRPALNGLNVSGAAVEFDCNNWPKLMQSAAVGASSTSGGLCFGASVCSKGNCFTKTNSFTRTYSQSLSKTRSVDSNSHTDSQSVSSKSQSLSGENVTVTRTRSNTTIAPTTTTSSSSTTTTTNTSTTTSSTTTTTSSTTSSTTTETPTTTTTTTSTMTTTTVTPPPRPITKTRSISRLPPTTLAPPAPPPVERAVAASSTAATTVSAALSIEPSAPMVASRTLGLSVIAGTCKHGYVENFESIKQQAVQLDFPQSLMPFLWLGDRDTDGWRPYLRGAVIANCIVAPIVVTSLAIALAALIDHFQAKAEFKLAKEENRLATKKRSDLFVKCKAYAVYAITLGIGLEGSCYAIIALLATKAVNDTPSLSYEDDVVIAIVGGIVPVFLVLYFFMSRLKRVLMFCSCDPAVVRKGKLAELELKDVYDSKIVIKLIQQLFGNECWARDSDTQIASFIETQRELDLKAEQRATIENENSRLSSIPRALRRIRIMPRRVLSETESTEVAQAKREIRETQEYMVRFQPRIACLHARFKGTSKNKDKMLFLPGVNGDGGGTSGSTSLSALAAAAAKSDAEKNSFSAGVDRVVRKIAPFTFFVDCVLNILMGTVRGMVTVGVIQCSLAGIFVVIIVTIAFLYSVIVFPRISKLSCYVDVLVNLLVCASGFMALAELDSTASLASSAISILAILSLSVSCSRMYMIVCNKTQLFAYLPDGGLLIPGQTNNSGDDDIMMNDSDDDGSGNNNNRDRAASAIGGVGASDGNSAMFLIENLMSVFSSGGSSKEEKKNKRNRNDSVRYALGGTTQEMSPINPNIPEELRKAQQATTAAAPAAESSSSAKNANARPRGDTNDSMLEAFLKNDDGTNNKQEPDDDIDIDAYMNEINNDESNNDPTLITATSENGQQDNDDIDLFNLELSDNDDDDTNNNNNTVLDIRAEKSITEPLDGTLSTSINVALKNEELVRRQKELEAFLGSSQSPKKSASTRKNNYSDHLNL